MNNPNYKLFLAKDRGVANHGWLQAKHTFSFADYYDEEKVNFGSMRVLNDDVIAAHQGFGTHPHNNMEIITIIHEGELSHKDSMGHEAGIKAGEVQVMSAGKGIHHSEFNHGDALIRLFQIWIFPNEMYVAPRYDQKKFDIAAHPNQWHLLVSPDGRSGSLYIHQDAFISRGVFENTTITYKKYNPTNLIFVQNVDGEFITEDYTFGTRDAAGIRNENDIKLIVKDKADVIIFEIPVYSPI